MLVENPRRFGGPLWPLLCAALMCSGAARGQWTLLTPDPAIEGYTNFLGQGLSFVDFNLDGWDDLTVPNVSGELHFHAGGPEGFTEVDLGITTGPGRPTAVMWLDIDNDGDRDFLHSSSMAITFFGGASTVSRSQVWIQEEGTFVDRTEEWGWGMLENRSCTGLAFHDPDLDGDLDVLIANYALPCEEHWLTENVLMEHAGTTFVDISETSGLADGLQPTFQGVWIHLDSDSLMDLFLINDAGVEGGCVPTNDAYLNNGDGTFSKASDALGLDVTMSSMSCTVADPDGDGEEEIFITNQSPQPFYTFPQQTAAFMDRTETGGYAELSDTVGLALDRWSWSAMWVDADLDGGQDLMVATVPFNVPGDGGEVEFYDNYWMHHPGPVEGVGVVPVFDEVEDWPGRNTPLFCLVRGDLDQDGDPDMVGLGSNQYLTLWENTVEWSHPDHHGLAVSVCGTHSNSEAIGTRLVLHHGGVRQQRTLRAGEDLFAQHSTTQFFGLGASNTADSLEVFWPDGYREVHHGLQADSLYRFVERGGDWAVTLLSEEDGMATIELVPPPKWTGLSWNGAPSDSLIWSGPVGAPLEFELSWFQGLYVVQGQVDWSEVLGALAGCANPVADNFDPAVVFDDGSCTYQGFCGEGTMWSEEAQQCIVAEPVCPPDLNADGTVGVADILLLLSLYGTPCEAGIE